MDSGRRLFRVYVDESGDRGWGGRASAAFVLSAVIISDEQDEALRQKLDEINDGLDRSQGTVLHWAHNVKTHAQRKYVARKIAESGAILTSVLVLKSSLMHSGTALSDPAMQYTYAVRRLLERVSWYVDDQDGEAIVTYAHIRRFPYERLLTYLEILRHQGTQIRWRAIRSPPRIDQPNHIRLLQMADLVAGCTVSALKADAYGDYESMYLRTLASRIYVRPGGKVTSYGLNVVGASGTLESFPWWPDVRAAIER